MIAERWWKCFSFSFSFFCLSVCVFEHHAADRWMMMMMTMMCSTEPLCAGLIPIKCRSSAAKSRAECDTHRPTETKMTAALVPVTGGALLPRSRCSPIGIRRSHHSSCIRRHRCRDTPFAPRSRPALLMDAGAGAAARAAQDIANIAVDWAEIPLRK